MQKAEKKERVIDTLLPEVDLDVSGIPHDITSIFQSRMDEIVESFPFVAETNPESGEVSKVPADLNWLREKLGLPSDVSNMRVFFYAIQATRHANSDGNLPKSSDYEKWHPYFIQLCSRIALRGRLKMPPNTPDEKVAAYVQEYTPAEQVYVSMMMKNRLLKVAGNELADKLLSEKKKEGATHPVRKKLAQLLEALPSKIIISAGERKIGAIIGKKTAEKLIRKKANEQFDLDFRKTEPPK